MKYTYLSDSKIKVSKICLGTMTFGEQNSEAESHAIMDHAFERGVNFFDTAEMYPVPTISETQGRTEEYIGSWFASRKTRDQVILATKITGPSRGMEYIRDPLDFSDKSLEEALNNSLRRLNTDYIDLYQLHWPERQTNCFGLRGFPEIELNIWKDNMYEILLKMNSFIQKGKIRAFGVSNETPWGLHRFLSMAEAHDLPKPIAIQNPYNLLNRTYEMGLSEFGYFENLKLLAYSPMAFGLLSGKYHLGMTNQNARLIKFPKMTRYNGENARRATDKYIDLAKKAGISPAKLALAFVNARSFVASNIIGVTNINQLKENLESLNLKLSEDLLEEIDMIHEKIPNPAP